MIPVPVGEFPDVADVEQREIGRESGGNLTGLRRQTESGGAIHGGRNDSFGDRKTFYETRPAGNSVSMEDQMMKVAGNQMDYQAATSLYTKSLGLLMTAIGKR